MTLGAWANFNLEVPDGRPQGSTVIFFDLKLNDDVVAPNSNSDNYEVAAFIDGKCRAIAEVQSTPAEKYWQLEVPGNYSLSEEDNDKEITFQVYVKDKMCTYELRSDPRVVFGSQSTYGQPSIDHVQLMAKDPTEIQLRDITMNVGTTVKLTDYLSISPTYATLPLETKWVVGNQNMATVTGDELKAQSTGTTTYSLVIPNGTDVTGGVMNNIYTANLTINNPATAINVPVTTYEVTLGQDRLLNAFLSTAYTLEPATSTDKVVWQISDPTIIQYYESNGQFKTLKAGVTTMTPVIYGDNGVVRLSGAAITITVKEPVQQLSSFTVTVTPDANGTGGTVTLTPVPANATYDIVDYQLKAVTPAGAGISYGDWIPMTFVQNGQNPLSYTYSAQLPGLFNIQVMKGTNVFAQATSSVEVPFVVNLSAGWQWKSNNFIDVAGNELNNLFGSSLTEARTQEALLFNDPSWGYVGSMLNSGISKIQMYKAKMTAAKTTYITGGSLPYMLVIPLQPGWNWVGSPYFYNRKLSVALPIGSISENLVIQGKNGSAEYANGQWNGNLTTINSGEGYLVYNPSSSMTRMGWATEVGEMAQGNEVAGSRAERTSIWHYDASRFANNMTVVATLNDIDQPEHYTLGAFVDGECRGEGVYIDGRMYVTAHVNDGEQVSFVLYNMWTGDYINVDQTIQAKTRIGSVNAPVAMTTGNATQGISTAATTTAPMEVYDLQGRKVTGASRTLINIVRMSDGTVRKIAK